MVEIINLRVGVRLISDKLKQGCTYPRKLVDRTTKSRTVAPEVFQHNDFSFPLTYENAFWSTCAQQKSQIRTKSTDHTRNLVLSLELTSLRCSNAWNSEVQPRFLENLWHPDLTRFFRIIFKIFSK
jgi:hypothetical protein